MENKKYVKPEMDVVMCDIEDVITTSGGIELPDDEWWKCEKNKIIMARTNIWSGPKREKPA